MKRTLPMLLFFLCASAFAGITLIIDGVTVFTNEAAAADGVCGASSGGTFASAPQNNLCSTGKASAVSGTASFAWYCQGTGGGAYSAKCTASLSVSPTTSCAAGEAMGAGDLVWSTFNVLQLWPVPAVTGSGSGGRAIQFVANASRYPRGVQLGGVDENQLGYGAKDYVVSACAHSFTPVGNLATCQAIGAGSTMGPLYLRFGPAQPRTFFGTTLPSLDCPLTPGGTYYVNFRDTTSAYGTVSSQFVIYDRTD